MRAPAPQGLFGSASRLGFGCASLGSRFGRSAGLRALAAAHEAGVNWIDVAPSYGDGEAETIVGEFLRGRRGKVHVCTKCGVAPGQVGVVHRLARPMARAVVRAAPHLRAFVARGRSGAMQMPLSPKLIGDSLESSLRRLRTDYVDVLALHDPDPNQLAREEIAGALADSVRSGKALAVGVAGSAEAAMAGLRILPPLVGHVQMADGPGESGLQRLQKSVAAALQGIHIVTHSLYSRPLLMRALTATGSRRARVGRLLADGGYGGLGHAEALYAAALDLGLESNRSGTVLLSMFTREHLAANVLRLAGLDWVPDRRPGALFARIAEVLAEPSGAA
jgi:aryl-alcohol dehydrogenase-like predicted oxidoreductase